MEITELFSPRQVEVEEANSLMCNWWPILYMSATPSCYSRNYSDRRIKPLGCCCIRASGISLLRGATRWEMSKGEKRREVFVGKVHDDCYGRRRRSSTWSLGRLTLFWREQMVSTVFDTLAARLSRRKGEKKRRGLVVVELVANRYFQHHPLHHIHSRSYSP